MELTIENPDINNVDEIFYAYIIQHNKHYDHFLIKCHFKLVFNLYQCGTWIKSNLFNNKTMMSWKKYLENVIDNFKNERYDFNPIKEKSIISKSNKMDKTYDSFIKHNMYAIEWKLKAMIFKIKSLINIFNET